MGERKMKATVFIASALLALSNISGAEITFYKIFESDYYDAEAGDVVEVPDGGYAIISNNWSWSFVRTDSVGNVLAQHLDVFGYTMCLNNAGELVVVPHSLNDSIPVHWTDQMGFVIRSKRYFIIENDWSWPRGIIETMDGGYAICSELFQFPRGFLLRIDNQGGLQWSTLFYTTRPFCLAETPDSGFVIGGSYSDEGSLTWVDANGNEEQTLLFGDQTIRSIAQTSTGYAITRGTDGVARIDYAGNILWTYTSEMIEKYWYICLADNGDVLALGNNCNEEYSGLTRLNPDDGTLVWERNYSDCLLYQMTATTDGGFALAGHRQGNPYDDIILVKTDSEGLCPEMGIEEGVNPRDDICLQVFPNPCSGSSSVRFTLSETAVVQLSVYDLSGRLVEDLINTSAQPGDHTILWNPDHTIPDGCYLFALDTCGERTVRRAVLLR
jgi:hypothetical protein